MTKVEIMTSIENYEFINYKKIIEISGGNKSFIRKYNELARKLFTNFPIDYSNAMNELDLKKLRKLIHNSRATLQLLDLQDIEKEIEFGRNLLMEHTDESLVIAGSVLRIELLCNKVLNFLADKF